MLLSDSDLKKELAARRIVFTPRLKPEQIGGASVDLTLDGKFWVFKNKYANSHRPVDLGQVSFVEATEGIRQKSIVLAPGQIVLGITKEKIKLPADIMGSLEGRSRYARMGLAVHITSALVQPGSDNHQVLEIVNFAPFPVKISEGMRISQVVFQYLKHPTSKPYARFGKVARKQ
ncbi:dCTP deaminase, dUMP-forming [uncultured archaeon]|nr:dCTP deaminase, dUMP-forming [uncultured archaeon]